MFETVEQAIDWVMARKKANFSHSFEDFKAFVAAQGNPQLKLRTIHVAGTNGKGSTTNYLANMLQKAGYRVGWFTSPHLISHLDRIRINEENIDADFFLKTVNRYQASFEKEGLSMFEIDTFISFLYFVEKKVDYAVYEVGMGGRLDSTNVIQPMISVITNIEMDHMAILGDTIAKIAYEKAGIIKPRTPVVTFESKPEALNVFARVTLERRSTLIHTLTPQHLVMQQQLEFDYGSFHVTLPTQAIYQNLNASLAIETILTLRRQGQITITDEQILAGLKTNWKGRFEKVSDQPKIYLDGAHNDNGIDALCQTLKALHEDCIIVFSALKDKTYSQMLKKLSEVGEVIVTQFENQRATTADQLALGSNARVEEDYHKALQLAKESGKTVVVTGSLYFISVVREELC